VLVATEPTNLTASVKLNGKILASFDKSVNAGSVLVLTNSTSTQ
jgi:hypothetical protein